MSLRLAEITFDVNHILGALIYLLKAYKSKIEMIDKDLDDTQEADD